MKTDKTTIPTCSESSQVYITYVGNTERNNIMHLRNQSHLDKTQDNYIILFESEAAVIGADKYFKNLNMIKISKLSPFVVAHETSKILFEKFTSIQFNILFNVTSVPRDVILTLLYVFENIHSASVNIEYYSTGNYGSFDYKDYSKPQNVHFFGGMPKLNLPTRLIILPGHEYNAAGILVAYYRPTAIVIGYSSPEKSTDVKNAEENKKAMEKSINDSVRYYADDCSVIIDTVNLAANNPNALHDELLQWINAKGDDYLFNNVMTSFTTRLSTVGLYLLWREKQDYQIVSTKGVPTDELKSVSDENPIEKLHFKIF